jgi:hypothetical protein
MHDFIELFLHVPLPPPKLVKSSLKVYQRIIVLVKSPAYLFLIQINNISETILGISW